MVGLALTGVAALPSTPTSYISVCFFDGVISGNSTIERLVLEFFLALQIFVKSVYNEFLEVSAWIDRTMRDTEPGSAWAQPGELVDT
ncbi:hypothetical protein RRG08_005554 [Elysia crispata]|uniref:Uncharacterized protein n=1 Tax=Elysia crispata TaxID=231223 RepID=A0AAE1E042_9GAST|nr:hypothetical protein RRG08_005554 [Elysia crispata]